MRCKEDALVELASHKRGLAFVTLDRFTAARERGGVKKWFHRLDVIPQRIIKSRVLVRPVKSIGTHLLEKQRCDGVLISRAG